MKEIFDISNNCKLKTINFLWDNWNIISETTVSSIPNSSLLTTNSTSYVWGIDLSGTLQGAGGVGGLLAVIRDDGVYAPTYDGNGNISEYIVLETGNSQLETGSVVAHYEYDAFGNTVVEYSPLLKGGGGNAAGGLPFSFRFSTKYWDNETGLYYYGYRFYKPEWERWLNRDPIHEKGGLNLYGFMENDSVNFVDILGLASPEITVEKCQAVLIMGHGSKSSPLKWKFPDPKLDPQSCAIGGAAVCWPQSNNPAEPNRQWPRMPDHDETILVDEEFNAPGINPLTLWSDTDTKEIDDKTERSIPKILDNVLSNEAKQKILKQLCKDCNEVKFIYITTEKGWLTDGWFGSGVMGRVKKKSGLDPNKTRTETVSCCQTGKDSK